MIKLLLLTILLTLSMNAHSYSYYYYDKDEIKVTEHSYRRYARPQIRTIINEYYHILKKISPLEAETAQLPRNIMKLERIWHKWQKNCLLSEAGCDKKLNKIYNKLSSMDAGLLKLSSKKIKISEKNLIQAIILVKLLK